MSYIILGIAIVLILWGISDTIRDGQTPRKRAYRASPGIENTKLINKVGNIEFRDNGGWLLISVDYSVIGRKTISINPTKELDDIIKVLQEIRQEYNKEARRRFR